MQIKMTFFLLVLFVGFVMASVAVAVPTCVRAGCGGVLCIPSTQNHPITDCQSKPEDMCFTKHGTCKYMAGVGCTWYPSRAMEYCIKNIVEKRSTSKWK